jgi:succinyl-CoA synthetase beta subunit
MNFEEHAAKPLIAERGVPVPASRLAATPDEAEAAAREIGPCVVKAQVPTGKRGKAGGIRLAAGPAEARAAAEAILGMEIAGHRVARVLVEAQVPIARELYAAILPDPASRGPMLLLSALGGMDVEEAAERDPAAMRRYPIAIAEGLTAAQADAAAAEIAPEAPGLAAVLRALYRSWRELDAELLEINPLVVTADGKITALDAKLVVDDAAGARRPGLLERGTPDRLTELEARAESAGLKYIELGGSVGILANGAGLTMTTMDAVAHLGGEPANFLEIGGEAYTKARTALEILLANPNVRSLVVNFCGAFARTDVMASGVVEAWKALDPAIPVFFTIHGTGEDEAVALVRRELGHEPFDRMDDAVAAAVEAARAA